MGGVQSTSSNENTWTNINTPTHEEKAESNYSVDEIWKQFCTENSLNTREKQKNARPMHHTKEAGKHLLDGKPGSAIESAGKAQRDASRITRNPKD